MQKLSPNQKLALKAIACYIVSQSGIRTFTKEKLMQAGGIENNHKGQNNFNTMVCVARQVLDKDFRRARKFAQRLIGAGATQDATFDTFVAIRLQAGMPYLVGNHRGEFYIPDWKEKTRTGSDNVQKQVRGAGNALERFQAIDQRMCESVDKHISALHWKATLKITGGDIPNQ